MSVRARAFTLGLVVLLIALAITPSAALGARSDKKMIWGPVSINGRSQFPAYHKLGVGIFEMDLDWATTAPTQPRDPANPADPAYRWPANVSYAIAQAAHYHMRIMLMAIATPAWANAGRGWNYPPTHVSAFAQFVAAASRRYPSVHLWMIWGEPDRSANWALTHRPPTGTTKLTPAEARAPHVYAQMLDASYGALKHVSRRNLVIGGNTYSWGEISTPLWIENLRLPNGRRARMDLYGHNPFCFRDPNLASPQSRFGLYDFSDLGRLERLLRRYLAPKGHTLRLFLSEWMIPTAPGDHEFDFYVLPKYAAKWVRDAWRIVRHSSWIYALGWIHFYDDPPGQGSTSGLLTWRGQPKPDYWAFKNG